MTNEVQQAAFETTVREHHGLLHKVYRMYASSLPDRQDLFQEILIQLWKSYPGFCGQSSSGTWLYRVAIYTAIAGLRKKKEPVWSTEPEHLPHTATDAYDSTQDHQLDELYKAVAKLNEIEKAVVMLYLEGKNYEDMEEILGLSQGNLRVKMNRIKDKLKQLIKT